ncbi:F-box protein [Sesamum angolense]|uniref:F-box protein n=1 Tax=Sesamum angolense TaxID=2727404 RepID=A0AAE1WPA5_9LAMI|nr:F-box protein [Sesamum angolense]
MDAEAKLDDMNVVMEILIRLPPKSVFRFISVSKTWEKTISTDPFFLRSYSRRQNSANRRRLLAILENKTKQPLDPELPPAQCIRFPDNPQVEIEQNDQFVFNSSNGLFLTGFLPSTFHVVNPVTKKCVALPPPPIACKTSVAIMCEDNFSELKANYIVLRAQQSLQNNIMQIDTYSSRTGEWTRSVLVATGSFELSLKTPTVANGVFHWNTTDLRTMVVYDPNDSVKNHVQLIQKPKCRSQLGEVTRSTTDDILWLFMIDTEHWKLFMLPKGGEIAG